MTDQGTISSEGPSENIGTPGHRSPQVFVSYTHDSPHHKDQVLRFSTFLLSQGIVTHLDRWFTDRRRDWYAWAIKHMTEADFVIVVASPGYRGAGDGNVPSHQNRGIQSEASLLRDLLHNDRETWLPKLLPVILPDHTTDDIPLFLQPYTADHYMVTEFTTEGAEDLLRVITAQPGYPRPPLGPTPLLPPHPPPSATPPPEKTEKTENGSAASRAPGAMIATGTTVTSWRPGRWLTILAAALAIAMLVAPSALAFNVVPFTRGVGEAPLVLASAIFSLLIMCLPLIAVTIFTIFRSSINSVSRDLHGASTGARNKLVHIPLIITLLAILLLINASQGNTPGLLASFLAAPWLFLYAGSKMVRAKKDEDELRRNWSYPLPTPLYPFALRQRVTLLESQLKGWARPLPKQRRERAVWMLDTLDEGAEKMREAAQRGRWCWLNDRPWLITLYILWAAVTTGLAMAAVVLLLRTGCQISWHFYLSPVFVLLASGALCWGTMDLGYRRHRWEGRAVAAEITENVEKLRRHLESLAAPPTWDLIDHQAVHQVNRGQAPG